MKNPSLVSVEYFYQVLETKLCPFSDQIIIETYILSLAEETSPPVSMKSKTGLNFMVSVGRAIESGDNALAKLLQASQEMVRPILIHHILY